MKKEIMKINKHWYSWAGDKPLHVFCESERLLDTCLDIYHEEKPDYALLQRYMKRYWDYCDTAVTQ